MTSISSLSFSLPLLETLTAEAPSSSNLHRFGDNYSLLEEMWLAVSAASWVGKTAGEKNKEISIFLVSLGKQICVCDFGGQTTLVLLFLPIVLH